MKLMPISKLGPHAAGKKVHLGVLLPGVSTAGGYKVELRIIHEKDQFIQSQPAFHQPLSHAIDATYGDFWETTVDLSPANRGKHWGEVGRYVYRYAVTKPNGDEVDWVVDPFAREFGVGRQAAFTYGYKEHKWDSPEAQWKTPRQKDLVLYELNIMEFAGSLDLARTRLEYLHDLGITGISLMPVTNVTDVIDWGYTPVGYFGVDERFGNRSDFQEFVEVAHAQGIAVLVDAIYGHTSSLFPYEYLYSRLGLPNPMMGAFAKDEYGPSVDWTKPFAQDFFYTVNHHWLEAYRVDGFRYDCVPNYWELGPDFRGYAAIVYNTYQWVKGQVAAGNPAYARFADGANPIRLIQCAEQLEDAKDALEQTYSTCTWQNRTIAAADHVAQGGEGALAELGLAWGADGLPTEHKFNGDTIPKAPLQYIENHDHSRFICQFGVKNPDAERNPLFEQGDRDRWYMVQPYLIGLVMAKGIPLLWEGQELCENSKIAAGGASRTGFLRIVHWEYFYDDAGRSTVNLVRRLLKARAALPHVKDGEHFFFNDYDHYLQHGVMLFARYYPNTPKYTLVALNFTDKEQKVPFSFPVAGDYREELQGATDSRLNLTGVAADTETWLDVPSHYGRVWTHA